MPAEHIRIPIRKATAVCPGTGHRAASAAAIRTLTSPPASIHLQGFPVRRLLIAVMILPVPSMKKDAAKNHRSPVMTSCGCARSKMPANIESAPLR